jgi:predicted dehydrogenase
MSHTIDGARAMVVAARETGKLLQIGHQRRSEPRYHLAIKMIDKDKILGRPICFHGQWDRAIASSQDMVCAPKDVMDAAQLKKWGYDSMPSFLNWRWYKRYGGGPIVDLGSHQIDVFSWFLKANPTAVMASGGKDYFKDREWYDNVLATFEYDTPTGSARGTYQVLTTTSYGGYYEVFNGTDGSLIISEADTPKTQYFPEFAAKQPTWVGMSNNRSTVNGSTAVDLKIGETPPAPGAQPIKVDVTTKKPWQFHLENFFAAIKDPKLKLNCPAELAFESCVSVLKVNEAIAAGRRLEFDPKEFKA